MKRLDGTDLEEVVEKAFAEVSSHVNYNNYNYMYYVIRLAEYWNWVCTIHSILSSAFIAFSNLFMNMLFAVLLDE